MDAVRASVARECAQVLDKLAYIASKVCVCVLGGGRFQLIYRAAGG